MSDEGTSEPANELHNSGSVCNLLESDTDLTARDDRMGKSQGKVIENGCSDDQYDTEMFLQSVDAVSSNESCNSLRLSFRDYMGSEVNANVALVEVNSPHHWVEQLSKHGGNDDDNDLKTKTPESSSQPSHTRSLSQTTSQLKSLKELANLKSDHVKSILTRSSGKKLESTSDNESETAPTSHKISSSDHIDDVFAKRTASSFNIFTASTLEHNFAKASSKQSDHASDYGHSKLKSVRTFRNLTFNDDDDKIERESVSILPTPDLYEIQRLESNYEHLNYHPADPSWKLDRRDSGHLYWRRDSSSLQGKKTSNRVKFRYDIEVCEFDSISTSGEEEITDDEGILHEAKTLDAISERSRGQLTRVTVDTSWKSALIISAVAVIGIIITASYGWILQRLHII